MRGDKDDKETIWPCQEAPQALFLKGLMSPKRVGRPLCSALRRQKPKAPNRNVNCAEAGRTGTQNPLLPFLDPAPQSCPSLVTTRPSGWWKWTPISTLHPMPAGSGSCPLPPTPLDLTKFPATRPLPPPRPPWPLVAAQVGARGERLSWQGWGVSGSAGPHGRAENRLPQEDSVI